MPLDIAVSRSCRSNPVSRSGAISRHRGHNVAVHGRSILVVLLVAALSAPAFAATKRPALDAVRKTPLTVAGTGFRALERVTLTAEVGADHATVRLRADRRGALTAVFRGIFVGRCLGYAVVARGAAGSRATVTVPPPVCAQP